MKIKLRINKKLTLEFLSITFAVFLGLLLNQWSDNRKNENLAKQSIDNILSEITDNKTKVQDMIIVHKSVIIKLDSILTLLDNSDEHGETNLDLNFQLISSTSWETAKLTQAIVYMDFDIVSDIAGIYDFQHYYESIVKDFVINNVFNKPEKRDAEFMRRIKNFLNAIIPIENNLVEYYDYIQTEVLK